jgi:hypothetical protein
VDKKDTWGSSDPFLIISRIDEDGNESPVFKVTGWPMFHRSKFEPLVPSSLPLPPQPACRVASHDSSDCNEGRHEQAVQAASQVFSMCQSTRFLANCASDSLIQALVACPSLADPGTSLIRLSHCCCSLLVQSEVKHNTLHPAWAPVHITLQHLCNADLERPLSVRVLDWDRGGGHDLIGEATTSLRDLQARAASTTRLPLRNSKKAATRPGYGDSGKLVVVRRTPAHGRQPPVALPQEPEWGGSWLTEILFEPKVELVASVWGKGLCSPHQWFLCALFAAHSKVWPDRELF